MQLYTSTASNTFLKNATDKAFIILVFNCFHKSNVVLCRRVYIHSQHRLGRCGSMSYHVACRAPSEILLPSLDWDMTM